MAIWQVRPNLDALNARHEHTAVARLGIVMSGCTDDSLSATMPVDERTVQIQGLLHGGASVLLAETLGSAAANHCVDQGKFYCVGLDIAANHVRGVRTGTVTGTARAVSLGRRVHVWEITIADEDAHVVCVARLTAMVMPVADA